MTFNKEYVDFFSANRALNNANFEQELFGIVALFAEDSNYGLYELYLDEMNRFFIKGLDNEHKNELMLRVNYGEEKELVIARVEFVHKRQGKMTELFRLLKIFQKNYDLGPIVIESALSDAIKNWCAKNNFVKDKFNPLNYVES